MIRIRIELIRVEYEGAVVLDVQPAVVVDVRVAGIAEAVTVGVVLVRVVDDRAVVGGERVGCDGDREEFAAWRGFSLNMARP